MLLCIIIQNVITQHNILQQNNIDSCYFWTINLSIKLHMWTIHVTHLYDYSYISGRTICASHWHDFHGLFKNLSCIRYSEMAFHCMKRHAIVHHYAQYQLHSIILHSTFSLIDVIFQRGICYISRRFMLHIRMIEVTYLDAARFVSPRFVMVEFNISMGY